MSTTQRVVAAVAVVVPFGLVLLSIYGVCLAVRRRARLKR